MGFLSAACAAAAARMSSKLAVIDCAPFDIGEDRVGFVTGGELLLASLSRHCGRDAALGELAERHLISSGLAWLEIPAPDRGDAIGACSDA